MGPAEISAGGGGINWLKSLITPLLHSKCSIEFLGPIYNQDDLIAQYQQASIFVYPHLQSMVKLVGRAIGGDVLRRCTDC